MAYDALLFDLDGVLLTGYHTDRAIYRAAAADAVTDAGRPGDPPDGLVDPDESRDVRRACAPLDLDASSVWGYREHSATVRENEQIRSGERVPFDDASVLADMADRQIAIVSNNRQGTALFAREHTGLDAIDVVRGRYPSLADFDRMKPDPAFLHDALDALDVAPCDALFVGDRRSDVAAGRNAGTDTALLVRDGDPPVGDPDPTHVIDSLDAIPDLG
ncbi:HAD family hydrolase [Halococcoides cellulosivorans]|uniref:HAD family hydrolase n=1 Tax=Halococcoides cellulosivorans TaxID=1679096 RepID=A0A2R4X0B8_9EURY|nr:HAD-IA family hydrolase [Halococcoides cellulosivorans]AWB27213.1 HAD family hydrolase [Halococcoides cellulosivorans]